MPQRAARSWLQVTFFPFKPSIADPTAGQKPPSFAHLIEAWWLASVNRYWPFADHGAMRTMQLRLPRRSEARAAGGPDVSSGGERGDGVAPRWLYSGPVGNKMPAVRPHPRGASLQPPDRCQQGQGRRSSGALVSPRCCRSRAKGRLARINVS